MGIREQKKAQARAAMAAAASELFGRNGYAAVSMSQIARAAGVSDQTLYNYFPTKESLVFDQAPVFEATLLGAVAERPPGRDPLDAFRGWFDDFVLGPAAERGIATPGGMIRLVAGSDTLHRALLALAHRVAGRLASELAAADPAAGPRAAVLADALLAVVVRTIERLGAVTGPDELPDVAARAHAALDTLRPLSAVDTAAVAGDPA